MTHGLAPRGCAGPARPWHARSPGRAGAVSGTTRQSIRRAGRCAGHSLADLLFCLAILAAASAFALASGAAARRSLVVDGAARHVALVLRAARTDAVRQGRSVAVQFLQGDEVRFRMVADGNGNGVRRAEIDAGTDPTLGPERRLAQDFPGTRLGVGGDCPGIDGGEPLTSASPGVQFGESGLVVFTPSGTASSGTAYLTDGLSTYAVRVLGTTGRTRILRFDPRQGQWVTP